AGPVSAAAAQMTGGAGGPGLMDYATLMKAIQHKQNQDDNGPPQLPAHRFSAPSPQALPVAPMPQMQRMGGGMQSIGAALASPQGQQILAALRQMQGQLAG